MSQYSEMMGSFIRTGDYPLEANYVFSSEDSLREFYSNELNKTTMYKGLLRVVEADSEGAQSLWWVVQKEDSDELEFKKLITFTTLEDLQSGIDEVKDTLEREIADRKKNDRIMKDKIEELVNQLKKLKDHTKTIKAELQATVGTEGDIIKYLETLPYKNLTELAITVHKFLETVDSENSEILTLPELQKFLAGFKDTDNLHIVLENLYYKILGDPTPDEHFNTFRDIENAIKILIEKTSLKDRELQQELDATQRGVGLEPNGNYSPDAYTHYLREATSVMNALRTLDALLYEVKTTTNLTPEDTETVDMTVRPYRDETVISAKVKISSKLNNQIVVELDGIYHNVDFDYNNGRLDILVNGSIVKYFDLGLSGLVSDGYYDSNTETIVIVLSLPGGEKQELKIPAGSLIEEWEVLNKLDSSIELHKDRSVSGKDTLSADVRISTNNKNILLKDASGRLLVKGTADNIRMNSGETVESRINDINSNLNEYSSNINSLRDSIRDEAQRAKDAEQELRNSIKDCQAECSSSIKDLAGKIESATGTVESISSQVNDLSKEFNEHKVQVEKDKSEINTNIAELKLKVNQNSLTLEEQKTSITNLELFKLTHEKDYETVTNQILTLTEEVNGKVSSVTLHKDSERAYTIFVDGQEIGTIDIPSLAIIKDVTYSDGILTIRFNGDTEDVRIDLNEILKVALEEVVGDVEQLKQDVSALQEEDTVKWNLTGDNKAIYLEKDYAISAKFENEDTRTPVVQVIEDKTHLGSSHFPTSIDSSVRPEANENGTIHKIAYLDDLTSLELINKDLEARVAKLEEILKNLEWVGV